MQMRAVLQVADGGGPRTQERVTNSEPDVALVVQFPAHSLIMHTSRPRLHTLQTVQKLDEALGEQGFFVMDLWSWADIVSHW
jgi:hypothetical protein